MPEIIGPYCYLWSECW